MESNDIYDYVYSFQRGERKGFEYFFHELYPALLFYAFRIVDDKVIAEDVVAESFVKIWERHTTFSHHKVIKSWLYTTVRNGCLNKVQQRARTQREMTQLAKYMEDEHETFVLHEMIRAEVIRELYQSIETLPTACRQIFKMLFIDGKTVREISEELKLSISTVKNQKMRGINLLKYKLSL